MKTFFYAAISVFLLASCTDITRKDIDISSIPILHEKFNIHNIDCRFCFDIPENSIEETKQNRKKRGGEKEKT